MRSKKKNMKKQKQNKRHMEDESGSGGLELNEYIPKKVTFFLQNLKTNVSNIQK